MRLSTHLLVLSLLASLSGASAAPLLWSLDGQSEVVNAVNMEPGRVANGKLFGGSAWDPYFWLKLPPEGVNAAELTWLEVRLYSSAPADLLDVYYMSGDGHWCLGGKLPIARGWAVYRLDLTRNNWRETTSGDGSRAWGGPAKQVSSFRLDPGNEAGRTIMVDYVRLSALPADAVEGVTVEPRGAATLVRLTAPSRLDAGQPLPVSAEFDVQLPPDLKTLTGYVQLRHGVEIDPGQQPLGSAWPAHGACMRTLRRSNAVGPVAAREPRPVSASPPTPRPGCAGRPAAGRSAATDARPGSSWRPSRWSSRGSSPRRARRGRSRSRAGTPSHPVRS